jgi:hypothetical protein
MTDGTERSEGREGMPGQHRMSSTMTPVDARPIRINSVNWLTLRQERL